jgi:hypothetical protein
MKKGLNLFFGESNSEILWVQFRKCGEYNSVKQPVFWRVQFRIQFLLLSRILSYPQKRAPIHCFNLEIELTVSAIPKSE